MNKKIDPFIYIKENNYQSHINPFIINEPEIVYNIPGSYDNEIFAKVPNYIIENTKYNLCISNYGRLYNLNTQSFINSNLNSCRYKTYGVINNNGKEKNIGIHRMVLGTFDNSPDADKFVPNHLNDDKTDNRLSNLEWATIYINLHHAMITGLKFTKLTEKDVKDICNLIMDGKSDNQIAKIYNTTRHNISLIHNKKIWKYITEKYEFPSVNYITNAILNETQVIEICELLMTEKYTDTEIGAMYGVHRRTINDIYHKNKWKYITEKYDFPKRYNRKE